MNILKRMPRVFAGKTRDGPSEKISELSGNRRVYIVITGFEVFDWNTPIAIRRYITPDKYVTFGDTSVR